MYKFLIYLSFLFLTINIGFSATVIEGGISFTVKQAREIAFENVDIQIPVDSFSKYLKDKFFFRFFKEVTVFSDGDYSIHDIKNNKCYYYSKNGNLKIIEIILNSSFPQKSVRYDINGNLDSVVLDIGNSEQFIFDVNKKLVAHWIGKNGYDENGELFGTRD